MAFLVEPDLASSGVANGIAENEDAITGINSPFRVSQAAAAPVVRLGHAELDLPTWVNGDTAGVIGQREADLLCAILDGDPVLVAIGITFLALLLVSVVYA